MKRRKRTGTLIVLAQEREPADAEGRVLALRGYENGVDDMRKLVDNMIRTIRKRYPDYTEMKPKEIYEACHWYVYQIYTGHGGWPEFLGFASEWMYP